MTPNHSKRGWILGPVGLLAIVAAGGWLFSNATGQMLHPSPQAIPSSIQTAPPPTWSRAVDHTRDVLRETLAGQNLPGLSVAVGAGGAIVWAEGFGWADLETRTPVTANTRFRIGTASTVLTAAAAGVLVEKGRLRLDDEIQSYVPEFPKKQWPVTLRRLMEHTAGLGADAGDDGPLFRQRCEAPVEALPYFAQEPLAFEPGTQHRYSNYGWILISAAVASAADQPFLQFMREQIFEPLGMSNTGAESPAEENPEHRGEPGEDAPPITFIRNVILQPLGIAAAPPRRANEPATIYTPQFRYRLHELAPRNLSCYAGSVAFYSTPSDLVRFALARRSDGVQDGEFLGHRVVSLLAVPDAGVVVAVAANGTSVDTRALARTVAEAFAPRGVKP